MKRKNVFFTLIMIVSMFLFTNTVLAEDDDLVCSALELKELREIAAALKVTYLPKTKIVQISPDVATDATSYTAKYLDVKVYNMHSSIYLEVENDNDFSTVVTLSDVGSDGSITFRQDMLNRKVNYTFTAKTTKTGCESQNLRTIKLTLPIYNTYSETLICEDIPDYYLCQEFVTSQVDSATFLNRVNAYKAKLQEQGESKEEKDNTSVTNRTLVNVAKYKYLIVGVIVTLGVVITIVIIKRKENV